MKKVEFHYREALRLNPQHPNARDNIDRFFSSSGAGDHSQSQVVSPRGKKGKKGKKGKNKEEKQRGVDDKTGGPSGRGVDDKTGGPSGRGVDVKDFGGVGGDGAAAKAASSEAKPKGKREKRKGASNKEGGGGGGGGSSSSKGNGGQAEDAVDGQVAGMSTWGIQEYKAALAAGVCTGKVEKNCRNNLGVLLFQNGKGSEALEHLHRAVELEPSWAEATYNLGYVKKELAKGKGSRE
jgi:tetratricopeptide (TPR) repeat protein